MNRKDNGRPTVEADANPRAHALRAAWHVEAAEVLEREANAQAGKLAAPSQRAQIVETIAPVIAAHRRAAEVSALTALALQVTAGNPTVHTD